MLRYRELLADRNIKVLDYLDFGDSWWWYQHGTFAVRRDRDNLDRLRSIQSEVVFLGPILNVIEFGYT
jgi:hypothetical protein